MINNKYFIRGIICGFILGGGIVYFVYKYNIPVIEKIKYITIHDLSINNITKNLLPSYKETLSTKKINPDKIKSHYKSANTYDSESVNNDSINRIQPGNKSTNSFGIDTEGRNIDVVKDEMIYTLEIPIEDKNLQKENEEEAQLSSDLTDNPHPAKKDMLLIEFWKSPLNYQGYRMSAGKLVIYGIADSETPDFIFFSNSLYMDYTDNYYHLDNTEQFKTLVKITNTNLINQLNQLSKK